METSPDAGAASNMAGPILITGDKPAADIRYFTNTSPDAAKMLMRAPVHKGSR
jgi:hypothetical protein